MTIPPDVPFTSYAFAASGRSTLRTMPDRLSDTYNVKDFGAVADGATGDRNAIQAAINAAVATNGGTIYFPPGNYHVGSRITVSGGTSCALSFIGGGCEISTGTGTFLSASMTDYILYIGHGSGNPVKTIQGIGFSNGQTGVDITSTEPTPGGNGMGCIYFGSGKAPSIMFCSISTNSGIGIFSAAENLLCSNTAFYCNYTLAQPDGRTFGIIFANGGKISCTKVQGCAIGILCIGDTTASVGGSCTAEQIDIELTGVSVRLGYSPIAWWSPNASAVKALGDAPVTGGMLNAIHLESPGVNCYVLDNVSNFIFQSCRGDSFNQMNGGAPYCQNGYLLKAVRNCAFYNCTAGSSFTVAALNLNGGGAVEGNLFEVCEFSTTGPGVAFINRTSYAASANANIFRSVSDKTSSITGGMTLAQLPPSPTTQCGPATSTNSDLPTWNAGASTSNVGRPITASGPANNTVLTRWNGSAWVIAG